MRLMGGLAIWLVAPSARVAPFARHYADLDFAVRKRDGRAVTPVPGGQGYVAERMFNSIHGAQRLNFAHADGGWTIDVVIDELRMSHVIDLRGRLEPGPPTLDLADLLLTKLQVWEINEKDLGDLTCLLADCALSDAGDGDGDRRAARADADRRRLGVVPHGAAESGQGRRLRARAEAVGRSIRSGGPGGGAAGGHRRRSEVHGVAAAGAGSGSGCAGTRPRRRSATSRRAPRDG